MWRMKSRLVHKIIPPVMTLVSDYESRARVKLIAATRNLNFPFINFKAILSQSQSRDVHDINH